MIKIIIYRKEALQMATSTLSPPNSFHTVLPLWSGGSTMRDETNKAKYRLLDERARKYAKFTSLQKGQMPFLSLSS